MRKAEGGRKRYRGGGREEDEGGWGSAVSARTGTEDGSPHAPILEPGKPRPHRADDLRDALEKVGGQRLREGHIATPHHVQSP